MGAADELAVDKEEAVAVFGVAGGAGIGGMIASRAPEGVADEGLASAGLAGGGRLMFERAARVCDAYQQQESH